MAVKKEKWYGNDVSNEVSLFENGLLIRRCGVMYEVIVWLGTGYVYGLFDDNDLIEDLESNRGVEGEPFPSWQCLAELSGSSEEDYRTMVMDSIRDVRALTLLTDMISYYGVQDAVSFDWDAKAYSESEIRKRLNKAL